MRPSSGAAAPSWPDLTCITLRPLLGPEPETLLQDAAGYRAAMAKRVPRLAVQPAQGEPERMSEVMLLIARDLFNPRCASRSGM